MDRIAYLIFGMVALLFPTSCKKQMKDVLSDVEWSRIYGGSGIDFPYAAAEGQDGTFMVVGYTTSNDQDITKHFCVSSSQTKVCGLEDAWILNISEEGNVIAQHSYNYGGAPAVPFPSTYHNSDRATSVVRARDGGWIVAGQTNSLPGYKSQGFVLKISPAGDSSWATPIPLMNGSRDDSISNIVLDKRGGFILTGSVGYFNSLGPTGKNDTTTDGYILRIDEMGHKIMEMTGGGWQNEKFNAVIQTRDSSYVAVGQTQGYVYNDSGGTWDSLYNPVHYGYTKDHGNSFDGSRDVYVSKFGADGSQDRRRHNVELGGEANDIANSVIETADGGFMIAGHTNSFGQDVSGNHSNKYDVWVVKLNKALVIQWQKTYGGAFGDEFAQSIVQTPDSGYVIAGQTTSNDGDVKGNHGNSDAWIIKIDKNGKLLWQKTLGGKGADGATNVITTSDGGLLITGYSFSFDGDVPATDRYGGNFWVIKLRRQ